jgi:hypothetical protein
VTRCPPRHESKSPANGHPYPATAPFTRYGLSAEGPARARAAALLSGEIASADAALVQIRLFGPPSAGALESVRRLPGAADVIVLSPVLPAPTAPGARVPFDTAEALLAYARPAGRPLSGCALAYESARAA